MPKKQLPKSLMNLRKAGKKVMKGAKTIKGGIKSRDLSKVVTGGRKLGGGLKKGYRSGKKQVRGAKRLKDKFL